MAAENGVRRTFTEKEAVMFHRIVDSEGSFFRSMLLRGQPEMSKDEKLEILQTIYGEKPGQFLTRYHQFMDITDLDNFDPKSTEFQLDYYLREIARRLSKPSPTKSPPISPLSPTGTLPRRYVGRKTRNRRYNAIRRLIQEGEYFSDAEMKSRNPVLYEQMIDRYMTEDERQSEFDTGAHASADRKLSDMFSNLAQNEKVSERREKQEAAEGGGPPDNNNIINISDAEKERLRHEFVAMMHERFLEGKDDEFFEYSTVDDNSDFDPADLIARDAEDAYFDSEEPLSDAVAAIAAATTS